MLAQAAARSAAQGTDPLPAVWLAADAAQLPFPPAAFDTTVATFALCTMGAALPAVLGELARVLRPGGRVLLVEHVRSQAPLLGAYQDLTAGLVTAASKGCAWNTDLLGALPGAGLVVTWSARGAGGTLLALEARRA